jgi:dihydroorotate dehydrogenase (NAD+) catalytic subunit
LGAKTKEELLFHDELCEFKETGSIEDMIISTDDGSCGYRANVTDTLQDYLSSGKIEKESVFVNCGPAPMLERAYEVESKFVSDEHIFSLVETMMKCGVGLCGSCADNQGRLTCADVFWGKYDKKFVRDKTGRRRYDN